MTETPAEPTRLRSVHEAWSDVMGEATALGKDQRNQQQNFNYRGIDPLMNLVGPILRRHGVSIIPNSTTVRSRDFTTAKGTLMHEVHVDVGYTIYGPGGDFIYGHAPGESADSGDKATPKAMSVAYRTFLLQALCLPTDEPDPDSQTTDRSPVDTANEQAQRCADGLTTATDPAAVQRVYDWASERHLLLVNVTVGENSMPLSRVFSDTMTRLGDTTSDEKAEQVLKDSLGATEVSEESSVTEPTTEGAQA